MSRPTVCLVTPATAAANNGNWQTAQRWARMWSANYQVKLMLHWDGSPADAMVALHARRSAADVQAWHAQYPSRPLVVVLTGTDLYRDIQGDGSAQCSLALATRLVVLNEQGPLDLPKAYRTKCVVCLQSTAARRRLTKTGRHLRALMVGHLRDEKSPATYFGAARRLVDRPDIRLDHIGAPLDLGLGAQAQALHDEVPTYRWLGELPHTLTRQRIQRAHVLVHPSRMEGGAHVVIEAITSGTPVLASRIAGNVGLLGEDYRGYFEVGDSAGLSTLLQRCRDDPAMLPGLWSQCAARASLFEPARERATLQQMMSELLEPHA